MPMLHQHPEGLIFVRTHAGTYGDTRDNFRADYGHDLPALPKGITERIYEPGVRHALVANNSVVDGGPMPWSEGDAVLARFADLIAKKTAREPQITVPSEAELAERQRKMDAAAADLRRQLAALKTDEERRALVKEFNDRLSKERF